MTGLTNCPSGGDPDAPGHLRARDSDESTLGLVADEDSNPDSWRVEVAARLERYRTRRKPRGPRYPNLLLPFDTSENWSRPGPPNRPAGTGSAMAATPSALAEQDFTFQVDEEPADARGRGGAESHPTSPQALEETSEQGSNAYLEQVFEQSAKVIEFPRSAAIPVFCPSALADPIFDRPRIVEVPEILPSPPALGGMLIEPAPQEAADTGIGAELISSSASIARRALAALVDGVVLAMALAAFVAIFLRLNPELNPISNSALSAVRGSLPTLAGALGAIAVLLWVVYDFLFVVYTGSTPGLRTARLRLASFDGSPLSRSQRRWRVLASFLSAVSAGLGYLWCMLDEDGLCWHDRITRSYVQSPVETGLAPSPPEHP